MELSRKASTGHEWWIIAFALLAIFGLLISIIIHEKVTAAPLSVANQTTGRINDATERCMMDPSKCNNIFGSGNGKSPG